MQEAAVKLLHMEYLDLHVEQRVSLLAALTSMALACEPIREHISAQAEALAAPSRKVCSSTVRCWSALAHVSLVLWEYFQDLYALYAAACVSAFLAACL